MFVLILHNNFPGSVECAVDRVNVEQAFVPNARVLPTANLYALPVRVKAAINNKEEMYIYRTVCKRFVTELFYLYSCYINIILF